MCNTLKSARKRHFSSISWHIAPEKKKTFLGFLPQNPPKKMGSLKLLSPPQGGRVLRRISDPPRALKKMDSPPHSPEFSRSPPEMPVRNV